MLTAFEIKDEIVLFCGCFKGSESELRSYIGDGKEELKESRLFALDFVLKAINFKK